MELFKIRDVSIYFLHFWNENSWNFHVKKHAIYVYYLLSWTYSMRMWLIIRRFVLHFPYIYVVDWFISANECNFTKINVVPNKHLDHSSNYHFNHKLTNNKPQTQLWLTSFSKQTKHHIPNMKIHKTWVAVWTLNAKDTTHNKNKHDFRNS